MKATIRFLPTICLFGLLAGCASHKPVAKGGQITAESEALHAQAVEAIEASRFIVRADEFYLSKGRRRYVKTSTTSYLSMQGNCAMIHYAAELFSDMPFGKLTLKDCSTRITEMKIKKNGDITFILNVHGEEASWLAGKLLITLFHNSNKCLVWLNDGSNVRFSGHLYPMP